MKSMVCPITFIAVFFFLTADCKKEDPVQDIDFPWYNRQIWNGNGIDDWYKN
jgi:hypothetical protein